MLLPTAEHDSYEGGEGATYSMANWNLTAAQLRALQRQPDHARLYSKLRALSPLFKLPSAKTARIVDKTPAYAAHLSEVATRTRALTPTLTLLTPTLAPAPALAPALALALALALAVALPIPR